MLSSEASDILPDGILNICTPADEQRAIFLILDDCLSDDVKAEINLRMT